MKLLNPLKLPLYGINLIEASAGTGKTYTLAIIYIRLLLKLGNKTAYFRPLEVKEILVVTFTEAATEELRSRIQENIHRLRLACIKGYAEDDILSELLTQIKNINLAIHQLTIAEQQMDEASIFTIHSFCKRMLTYSTIEFGKLPQRTLLEDEFFLYQQATADFWRQHYYSLSEEMANIVQKYWNGPEDLLIELMPFLHGDLPKIYNSSVKKENIILHCEHIITLINQIRQQWCKIKDNLLTIININNLNRSIYNKNNLTIWIKKIDRWATQTIIDYDIPKEIERFKSSVLIDKTINNKISPKHLLFEIVEEYYSYTLSLKELIFTTALNEIRQKLKLEKQLRSEIGFDDLLNYFDYALLSNNGEILAKLVRSRYPVAMIDEFQDTNPQQYRIFYKLYNLQPNCALLLIGDPKQSIYAFRGADIFTYIAAKSKLNNFYTLNVNWRSSPEMVNAINQLFQYTPLPFIFDKIPFSSIKSNNQNIGMQLIVNKKIQPAINFWLQSGDNIRIRDYQQIMARQCAVIIRDWLVAASDNNAWLKKKFFQRLLQPKDIAILVRNKNEASLINEALIKLKIPVIYLSSQDSIFETYEANELLWLLQAILAPEQNDILRRAFATSLLGLTASKIDAVNSDKQKWEKLVEEFTDYQIHWQKYGILSMLRYIMSNYCIAENLLSTQDGNKRLTNLLHLGELLQSFSMQLTSKYSLMRWLSFQIKNPNPNISSQKLRIESDQNAVRIITIHKSKGLEFPLVFLPFAANFRQQKISFFHDRHQYQAWLDLNKTPKNLKLAEEERLSEDLRLFYVALTRSIYHCSIGIASLSYKRYIKTHNSDLHLSAPGYLIQQGNSGDFNLLLNNLKILSALTNNNISFCFIKNLQISELTSLKLVNNQILIARKRLNSINDLWRITSYTDLNYQEKSTFQNLYSQKKNSFSTIEKFENNRLNLTPHTFPSGKVYGVFLHNLLKQLDFTKLIDQTWLNIQLEQNNIDIIWLTMIEQWVISIINTPLLNNKLSLANLSINNKCAELQFYLPVKVTLTATDIDYFCKLHDSLSARSPILNFPKIKGMLTGFIDLVFYWKGRYYLLDYKTNWLGFNSSAYNLLAMEQEMINHRYELQYQLYTLAFHRFLRSRIEKYNYQQHFGKVFYLFLRGIDKKFPNNGIYSCRPNEELINKLDYLFDNGTSNL